MFFNCPAALLFPSDTMSANFNTLAVIVDTYADLNGEVSPVLREVGLNNKLSGGKWVANIALCQKA